MSWRKSLLMWCPLSCTSRDKAYVPGAKPKADMEQLNKELLELVESLRPKPEECQRQRYTPLLTQVSHPVLEFLLHAAVSPDFFCPGGMRQDWPW